jgi:hypothetical protein
MRRKKYAGGTGASGVSVQNYVQTPQEAMFKNDILKAKAEADAQDNPWAIGTELATSILSDMAGSGDLKTLVNPQGKTLTGRPGKMFELGGEVDPTDPAKKLSQITGAGLPTDQNPFFNTKVIKKYQPGVSRGKDGKKGFYLYNRLPTEAGFNVETDREFILQENFNALQRSPQWADYLHTQTKFEGGGQVGQNEVELEGEEVIKTPSGETAEIEGPSHAQGGVPLQVTPPNAPLQEGTIPENTQVFSDKVTFKGKTIAEREAKRTAQESKLDKILSGGTVDIAVKNGVSRRKHTIQSERDADLMFQELVKASQEATQTQVQGGPEQFWSGTPGIPGAGYGTNYSASDFEDYWKKYQIGLPKGTAPSLKGFHDKIGISSKDAGYGKTLGPGSYKAASKLWGLQTPPSEELYSPDTTTILSGLPEPSSVGPTPSEQIMLANYAKDSAATPPPVENEEGQGFTAGDFLAMAGTAYSAFAPMQNTLNNRAGDTLNPDFYKNVGEDTEATWDEAQALIEAQQANALKTTAAQARMAKRAGRAGARGVNQVRMMDFLANEKENEATNQIYANASAQAMQTLSGKAQSQLYADQLKASGATAADDANRRDRDAFNTALGKDMATKGQGIAQLGKMLNQHALNPLYEELLKNQGEHLGMTNKAKMYARRKKQ